MRRLAIEPISESYGGFRYRSENDYGTVVIDDGPNVGSDFDHCLFLQTVTSLFTLDAQVHVSLPAPIACAESS
jgi:hypothetical protein